MIASPIPKPVSDELQTRITSQAEAARRLSNKVVYGGRLRDARAREQIDVENPATEETIGTIAACGREDVEAAASSAQEGFLTWSRLPVRERGRFMLRAADHLEGHIEEIARLAAFETGNALATQCRGEARTMVDILRYYGGLVAEILGTSQVTEADRMMFTRREPLGIVGAIIPWNAPLMQTTNKVAPALAAGNSILLKSAELAPLAVTRIFELLQDVLPPGVANLVTGTGEEAGRLICEHPLVRKITFTGSSAVGSRILHYAADKIVPVTAELGGKNPCIVMADANIDKAARGILQGLRLQRQGQSCSAGTRIYIHDSLFDAVIGRVLELIPDFRIGDPLDEETQVGSIISRKQFERVNSYIEMARETPGARILCGGTRPEGLDRGYFFTTTLIEGVPANSPVCRDEIFGPVATVARWTDFDAVIAEANDSQYGLAATIFTENLPAAFDFIARIEAGFIQVNQFAVAEANIEYGGTKMSGMGRELSLASMIQHFTWSKTVIVNTSKN
ncbi:aldehyde dehydrogenase family protein [Rhizobium sp. Root482]|uniref:aldehyde dehydrogenase family protein n=1 Tax=Rhizobium sp. Root482 TaxID=1736543 RepID=UPI0009EA65D9|nr:aldehyde dehydrogenase family protein [Rhizobium sp. Root482]